MAKANRASKNVRDIFQKSLRLKRLIAKLGIQYW
jgi:hypothetical protein